MQAVILAAGKGTRMGALTQRVPKSMLVVAEKPILEWKLEALPDSIDEVVIVVGYLGEVIREKFGNSYEGKKVTYVTQVNPVGGTMDALLAARALLHDTFLVMNGDDIHVKEDLVKCVLHEWALAVCESDDVRSASSVQIHEGEITDIVEADRHGGGAGLAGVGVYVLDGRVFDVEPVVLQGRSETGLPQTMLAASRKFGIPISAVSVGFPLHFTTPDDLQRAEMMLRGKK